ncbi:aldo/keto reductase [Vallitalea okinawensis]|uniref:aldo/keto reductase n=1 Tax=Vallitalea okinawensis TaxID=2078660 RepID=UPI000CFC375E|nr:aldo/keto reductase [Vallitalea okinawensis]
MLKRRLGKTDLELSIIGFGGFHLLEIASNEAKTLLNAYLDAGGNYIETAASYGNGMSEYKIGEAVSSRRNEFYLATKTGDRGKKEAMQSLEDSLTRLKTDYVDVLFIHGLQKQEELEQILGPDGALEAFEKAKKDGKVRHIAISSHGRPNTLYKALQSYPFDLFMTGMNYYDKFNYPQLENEIIPYALDENIGMLAMKSLADGYLYRSVENALKYSLSLPVTSVVMGINNMEQLKKDIELAQTFKTLTSEDKQQIYDNAPELGDYVCRLCGKCITDDFDPTEIFLLEGLYDRQMDNKIVDDTALYALRERLKHWFGQKDEALKEYSIGETVIDINKDYSYLNQVCPYGIDIDKKLKICHEKLSNAEYIY